MRLFRRAKTPIIDGELGCFGLGDWWLATFTEEERTHIEHVYQPFGAPKGSRPLTQGRIASSTGNAVKLLSGLAGWFKQPEDRYLARRIVAKAEELAPSVPLLDRHFMYQAKIEIYYRDWRNDPAAREEVIAACQQQIAIAPQAAKEFKKEYAGQPIPSHVGYRQLALIHRIEKNYIAAIAIATEAYKRGWKGSWAGDIAECEANLAKQAAKKAQDRQR